jgi:hypothetical protein
MSNSVVWEQWHLRWQVLGQQGKGEHCLLAVAWPWLLLMHREETPAWKVPRRKVPKGCTNHMRT